MDYQNSIDPRPENAPYMINVPLGDASSLIQQQFTEIGAHSSTMAAEDYRNTIWMTQPHGANNSTHTTFPYSSGSIYDNHLSGNDASSGYSSLFRGDINALTDVKYSMLLEPIRTYDAPALLEEQLVAHKSVYKEMPAPMSTQMSEMSLSDVNHFYQSPGPEYDLPIQQVDTYIPESYGLFHDSPFGFGEFTYALFSENLLPEENFEDQAIDYTAQDATEPIPQITDDAEKALFGLVKQASEILKENQIYPIQDAIEVAPYALVSDTSVYFNNDVTLGDAYEILQFLKTASSGLSAAGSLPEVSETIDKEITV